MTQCQQCHTRLVAEGIPQGQQVRCVKCESLFRLGDVEKISADRLAWRSFWLGLSSLVLLFFTGLPAIYYGIRSLLRMRFTKPRPGDRFAAVAGTVMGTIFGLFGGLMAVGFATILAVTLLTLKVSEDGDQILQQFATVFEQPPPAGMIPTRGTSILDAQHFFDFVDNTKVDDRNIRMHLIHSRPNMQQTSSQIVVHLRQRQLSSSLELQEKDSRILKWEMDGQEVEIRKTVFEVLSIEDEPMEDNSNSSESSADTSTADSSSQTATEVPTYEVVQYFGFCRGPSGISGMTVSMRYPNPVITEEQVREMFANVRPRTH